MIGDRLESEVRSIVERAGFQVPRSKKQMAAIRRKIPGQHQVDVMGWDEDFLVAIECTGKRDRGGKSLKTRISEVSDECRDIRQWWRKESGPKATVKMVLATRNIKISEKTKKRAQRKGISIWDDEVIDHFKKTVTALGLWTRYEIMWSLHFLRALGSDPIIIDGAVEMKQEHNRIYVFPISPEKLLKVAFVSRRDPTDFEGYQRIIQAKKLHEIRDYLAREKGLVPNSIIVNLLRGAKFKSYPGFSTEGTRIGKLFIAPIPCSAWVIDGQHRLMAFSSTDMRRLSKRFRLSVVAFCGLKRDRQARLFLKINETQTRVNAGLRADLASELYPYQPRGAAALVVKKLAEKAPFKGLIALRPWRRNKLRLANFSDALLRCGIISKTEPRVSQQRREVIVKTVRRFFAVLRREIEESETSDFVFSNNGVAVSLRILQRAISCSNGRLTAKRLNAVVRPIAKFSWRRALRSGIYSSEGDRLKLAERIMKKISGRCAWFSPLPK